MPKSQQVRLDSCLFHSANSLARAITRMADDCFATLAMSTSHAFLVMLVADEPGITQKELSQRLNLAQSTVSRFADSLVRRGLVRKVQDGKSVRLSATKSGKSLLPAIHKAWMQLHKRYAKVLGEETAAKLTKKTMKARLKLNAAHQAVAP